MPFPNSTLQFAISLLLCSSCCVYADTNNSYIGSICSKQPPRGGGAKSDSWTANFYSVFNSIEEYVPISGFYKAEAGEGTDKIYGLVQCRGDLSPSQCQNCTTDAFEHATDRSDDCDGSRDVSVWMHWCYLHYSNQCFYGNWSGFGITASYEAEDDAAVAAKGMEMMAGLAAAAPNATRMFGAAEVDVGNGGKRYGVAQCSRDLDEFGCRECLEKSLKKEYSSFIGKKRWQIAVMGCFMMYDASTISPPFSPSIAAPAPAPGLWRPKNAANRAWAGRLSKGMITTFAVAMGYLL